SELASFSSATRQPRTQWRWRRFCHSSNKLLHFTPLRILLHLRRNVADVLSKEAPITAAGLLSKIDRAPAAGQETQKKLSHANSLAVAAPDEAALPTVWP